MAAGIWKEEFDHELVESRGGVALLDMDIMYCGFSFTYVLLFIRIPEEEDGAIPRRVVDQEKEG